MASLQTAKEPVGKWECPTCLQVSSKEIVPFSNCYSMCSLCISKITTYSRNYDLAEVLDLIKYKCCWDGCNKELPHRIISEHEEQCSSSPNALKLCRFMGYTKCNFQFTLESMTDDSKFQRVVEHFRYCHGFARERRFKVDKLYTDVISVRPLESRTRNQRTKYRHGNYFDEQLIILKHDDRKYLFLRVARIYLDKAGEEILSILFVQLTPDLSGEEKLKFNLSIKCFFKVDTALAWGLDCAPVVKWGIIPMKIDDFMKLNERPEAKLRSFPFPMAISHLEKYYSDGNNGIEFIYHVEVI